MWLCSCRQRSKPQRLCNEPLPGTSQYVWTLNPDILFFQAIRLKVNPLYLMIPGTVGCSYAFMLPVSTPPNSIAFSTGHLMVKDMASIQSSSCLSMLYPPCSNTTVYIFGTSLEREVKFFLKYKVCVSFLLKNLHSVPN